MKPQLSPLQRVERAKIALMNHPRLMFLAGVMMLGKLEISTQLPTAWTDGLNVWVNPDFVQGIPDEVLRAVLFHEYAGHIMHRHLTNYQHLAKQDAVLANMAMDYVVNRLIVQFNEPRFMYLPENVCYDPAYNSMDEVQIFNKLLRDRPSPRESLDYHDWDSAGQRSEEDNREIERKIVDAVRQSEIASRMAGGKTDRWVHDLIEPKLDWRQVLRDFIVSVCSGEDAFTYSRPKRRWLGQSVYIPSSYSESVERVVIAIDTSGSVGSEQLSAAVAEAAAALDAVRPSYVDVIYWDNSVCGHETYESPTAQDLRCNTRPVGGGGTDVTVVPAFMQTQGIQADCVIVITDGYTFGGWGKWDCPVLWVLTTDVVPPVGTAVRLEV